MGSKPAAQSGDDRARRAQRLSERVCFYCFAALELQGGGAPEVDHFFPHALKQHGLPLLDGVWNLVLACQECNRGVGGKAAQVPSLALLARLHRRNEFLIGSHHPLRETLRRQTGATEEQRRGFLNDFHGRAWALLLHIWEPETRVAPLF